MVEIPNTGTVEIKGTVDAFYRAAAPDLFGESYYRKTRLRLESGELTDVWFDIGFDGSKPGATLSKGDQVTCQVGRLNMDLGAGNVPTVFSFTK
jgi:hypothetical protein